MTVFGLLLHVFMRIWKFETLHIEGNIQMVKQVAKLLKISYIVLKRHWIF